MTDPYGTVRAQILDLQGNAVGGQPSNNDWRLVVDNEQLKFNIMMQLLIVEMVLFLPDNLLVLV